MTRQLVAVGWLVARLKVLLAAVVLVAAAPLVPANAGPPAPALAPCCDSNTCELVSARDCDHREPGTTCDGVVCSGCCQGLAGNPNTCNDNFGKVPCLQGAGSFSPQAHCSVDNTACEPGSPNEAPCTADVECASGLCEEGFCATPFAAPTLSNYSALFVMAALLLLGMWSVQRLARRRKAGLDRAF